jgi:hypothetical protein
MGNSANGVTIWSGASSNQIGGSEPGLSNVISGNDDGGIGISGDGTSHNVVQGNLIGTDVTGTQDLGNTMTGIFITDDTDPIDGPTENLVLDNVIANNGASGVVLDGQGATGNIVAGNLIGTDIYGTSTLPNSTAGVWIVNGAANNTIGGTTPEERNLISGNNGNGIAIVIEEPDFYQPNGNLILGNFIGTDVTGLLDLGNTNAGVFIADAFDNVVGGELAGERNLISGNDGAGVTISGGGATGNLVQGNYIGTDVTGSSPLGNGYFGVIVYEASDNTIGGELDSHGNVISGNAVAGVMVVSSTQIHVPHNLISFSADGTSQLPNGLGDMFIETSTEVEVIASVPIETAALSIYACDLGYLILTDGDSVVVNCGSLSVSVIVGPVEIVFESEAWTDAGATLDTGNSLTFEPHYLSFTTPESNVSTVPLVIDGSEYLIESGTTFKLAVANDDTASTLEDTSVSIDVMTNDSFNVTTKIISVTPGEYGTATSDGSTVTYIPEPDFCGSDLFTYTLSEGTNSTDTAMVKVSIECVNDAPIVGFITAPTDPIPVNTPVEVSGEFFDVDETDTHTATWNWGDGNTTSGLVDQENRTVTGSHIYTEAGVYTLQLEVTDQAGDSDSAIFTYIVIFDPSEGFVTGGGWIDSLEGAYAADPSLTGKATFGFVSKYKKGADVPSGQTEFKFHVADLNFHSDVYQWLVVAGPKAQFKGTGTINGAGNYGFMVTAVDEELTPSTDVDLFRIKIWDKDSGDAVFYDNQMDAGDDADPTTAIEGGNIKIHKAK